MKAMMMRATVVFAAVGSAVLLGADALKVGFLGDTTASSSAANVYKIMRDQGVDLVVQNGDYDYYDRPDKWADFLDKQWYDTGRADILMSSGNHDVKKWDGSGGYQTKLYEKLSRKLRSSCRGRSGKSLSKSDYGLWTSCAVDDVQFVMIGWDEMDGDMSKVVDFVHQEFDRSKARWRVCVWHRPEGSLNPGHRHTSSYGQWEAYEACREQGALIVSGHTHCYGRTKLLSHFESKQVSRRSRRDRVELGCGESVSIVSGMGGKGPDDWGKYAGKDYMEKAYTTRDGRDKGVLVCDLPSSSGEGKCEMFVGDAPGRRHDVFALTTSCRGRNGGAPAPAPAPGSGPAPVPGPNGAVDISVYVKDGDDDVEEDERRGRLSFTSSDLELLHDRASQVVGIRWEGVRIPRGATVIDARIEFRCDERSAPGPGPRVAVAFDKDSDSDEWATARRPSQRKLTSAVEWKMDEEWSLGAVYKSPNLAPALQEVVGIFDWASGNAVSVVLKHASRATSARRTAESYEGDRRGAKLRVRYVVGSGGSGGRVPPAPAPSPSGSGSVSVRVSTGSDDVEQMSGGRLSVGSSDLELAYDRDQQVVGIRFRSIGVPRGARITGAYVESQPTRRAGGSRRRW